MIEIYATIVNNDWKQLQLFSICGSCSLLLNNKNSFYINQFPERTIKVREKQFHSVSWDNVISVIILDNPIDGKNRLLILEVFK